MVIHGSGGTVRVGPRIAGTIATWRLERLTPEPTFRAVITLAKADAFQIQQRPIVVWLAIGSRTWAWLNTVVTGHRDPAVLELEVEGAPFIR
jgi:hypothetical protein